MGYFNFSKIVLLLAHALEVTVVIFEFLNDAKAKADDNCVEGSDIQDTDDCKCPYVSNDDEDNNLYVWYTRYFFTGLVIVTIVAGVSTLLEFGVLIGSIASADGQKNFYSSQWYQSLLKWSHGLNYAAVFMLFNSVFFGNLRYIWEDVCAKKGDALRKTEDVNDEYETLDNLSFWFTLSAVILLVVYNTPMIRAAFGDDSAAENYRGLRVNKKYEALDSYDAYDKKQKYDNSKGKIVGIQNKNGNNNSNVRF